jgi:hypothetical protein
VNGLASAWQYRHWEAVRNPDRSGGTVIIISLRSSGRRCDRSLAVVRATDGAVAGVDETPVAVRQRHEMLVAAGTGADCGLATTGARVSSL